MRGGAGRKKKIKIKNPQEGDRRNTERENGDGDTREGIRNGNKESRTEKNKQDKEKGDKFRSADRKENPGVEKYKTSRNGLSNSLASAHLFFPGIN